ncbi:[NiFe] hydrogenase metallocenter assembly protein HypE [Klebsiella michiganensis]|uniref:[NiFe] hydrogenase metallocenter assembly protein HypE n=1 Tax=Klebsiella michiganensis TaxID=1134687 RepID=A0A7H4PMJ4_9ENTR|nr:[NiFe] hydrogenase metallocenter assembly protein HypE [Klebsiella michiganensis]
MGLDGALSSDCAVLTPLIQTLRDVAGVKALRDATRGGVNAVAHEFAAASGCGIELHENKLPGERYRARRVRAAGAGRA